MDPVVLAIRQSDREALNQFLARHRERLRDWVRFRLGVPAGRGADPSDAVQEVSVKVWEAVGSFEGTTESQLLQWFQRHLRWWVIDLSRRKVLRTVSPDPAAESSLAGGSELDRLAADTQTPSQLASQWEKEALIREAASALSNEQMAVLTLRDVDSVRLKEIALRLGASAVEVAQHYLAGAAALRAAGVFLHSACDDPAERVPQARLARALEQLPAVDRDAVILKHLEEFTMIEAAAALETTPAAIGSAVYRGMKQLKVLLDASGE